MAIWVLCRKTLSRTLSKIRPTSIKFSDEVSDEVSDEERRSPPLGDVLLSRPLAFLYPIILPQLFCHSRPRVISTEIVNDFRILNFQCILCSAYALCPLNFVPHTPIVGP